MGHHQNHYTAPSRLTRAGYRLVYDPLRAGYLRRLVASLELGGTERVLDFGSGAGSEAIYLARALDRGGRLTCLDVSPAWLAEACHQLRRQANVEFLLGEAPAVALPAEGFDLIFAHFVVHDVDRAALPATLGALARSLRPDGRFVVVEPDASAKSGRGLVPSAHRLHADELRAAMAAAGLAEQSRTALRPPFGSAVQTVYVRV
ncbi:MAG: class I SAM-dependent methyltransferase [Candidatus Limnocylindrales bacterium]|jgi:ubiquinone/menaquinone biosynthesis C-methylase UbiE